MSRAVGVLFLHLTTNTTMLLTKTTFFVVEAMDTFGLFASNMQCHSSTRALFRYSFSNTLLHAVFFFSVHILLCVSLYQIHAHLFISTESSTEAMRKSLVSLDKHRILTPLSLGLLLGSDDLEVARVQGLLLLLLLLLGSVGAALLGNFRPPAASSFVVSGGGSVALVDNALVSQLTAAKELLGKVTRVESAGSGMNGFSDEFGISWETEEGRDKVLGCEGFSKSNLLTGVNETYH